MTTPVSSGPVRRLVRLLAAGARPVGPWRMSGPQGGVITLPHGWRRGEQPVWFRHRLRIDAALRSRPLLLHLDVAEGLLFVDGRPYHGLDRNHQDIVLPPALTGAGRLALAIETTRAAPFGGAWFRTARLSPYDEQGHRLLHALRALVALRAYLPDGRARRKIDRALAEVDGLLAEASPDGDSGAVFASADARIRQAISRGGRGSDPGVVHLIGHSHIDVVWLWTLAETRRKCARTFATTLRLMERHPQFRFAQSQALLYQFVKASYPALYAQVRDRVREGRWEVVGSTWVEPDCNIPNGESLLRQIVYGRRFFEREFGAAGDVLWLPDTFGYAWSLPQMLRQCGVRMFFTAKLNWNDTTRFPHHSFRWEGLDGTRVLAHMPPVGLEGLVTPAHLARSWTRYAERRRTPHVLQTFGYGDGGGGVTDGQLGAAALLADAPSLPASRLSTVDGFFRALSRDAARLPVWRDELYLELHRGTYTTHAWIKRANRKAESALYTTELLCALGALSEERAARPAAQAALESLWKRLLLNQFHDIVPGTAIEAAYGDTRRDFDAIDRGCARLQRAALDHSAPRRPSRRRAFTVFNPLPWDRLEHVRLPGVEPETITDQSGRAVPLQAFGAADDGGVVCAVQVPALGCVHLAAGLRAPRRARAAVRPPGASGGVVVDAPLARLRFDASGALVAFADKIHGRDVVLPGQRLNAFQAFRDEPASWEAWDIDPEYARKPVALFTSASVRVLESGPVRWRVRVILRSGSRTRIEQDVLLYAATPRVDFETRLRWHERRTLLKVAFPLALDTHEATYEIPFGAVARDTRGRTARDRARWEVAGQQWADLSERRYGVSLLNDSRYGYDCSGTTLRMTLVRSPRYPHQAEPMTKTSRRCTDQGDHVFAYALWPHAGSWQDAETVRRAREFNVPVLTLDGFRPMRAAPLLRVDAAGVQVSAIKPADEPAGSGDVIVRLYECHGRKGTAAVRLGVPCDEVRETDPLERPGRAVRVRGGAIRLVFRPFEIKTLRLVRPRATAAAVGRAPF